MPQEGDWTHGFIEANGIRFHYVAQGEGELVLMLHGFPENWYSWRHQIPVLAERFKVVAPDLRGYNLSDKPHSVADYDSTNLLEDVRGMIRAFGADKTHLVAHDWGGAVAWMFAFAFPGFLDKLVVMNCPHPAVFLKNLMTNPRQIMRSWYMFFFQLPRVPEILISAGDYLALERSFRGWAVNKDAFTDEDIRVFKEAMSQPGALTAGINYYRAMFRNLRTWKAARDFPAIESPTLLVWAEKDRALGKELTYGMDRYFSGDFRIRYIPNCSHWVQQEQPGLVNEFLMEFL